MEEERNLSRELEESEALRRGILAAVPVGVVHVLSSGRIQVANAEALRILGLTHDEITDTYTTEYASQTFNEDGSPCAPDDYPVTKALTTGQPQSAQTIGIRLRDGSTCWCVFRAVPMKDAATGVTTGAIVAFVDVTNQMEIARTLRDSEAKLSAIMANAPNLIFTLDPEGRITFMNRTIADVEEMVDTTSIVGESVFTWLNPRDHDMVREKLRRVLEHGEMQQYEVKGLDGVDPNTYVTNLGPVWREGRVAGVAGIVSFITEIKKAEAERIKLVAELHEAQRLEGLGRLAGGLAHDFNNLLTIVQGNVDLLLSPRHGADLTGASEAAITKIRERIGEIGDAARKAAMLTRQLLAFGRKQELAPRTVDLNGLVEGMAPLLRRLLAEHTTLELALSLDIGTVRADPVEIERVLVNLVMNAGDAMPDGGSITIRTRPLDVTIKRDELEVGRHVVLEVRDRGTGMNDETLKHAFEPFFTTKEIGKGTGLGLATVHGIVRQSGGLVEIDTEVGLGTTVRAIFPEAVGRLESRKPSAAPSSREAHRGTLLVVEDDVAVRDVTRLVLEANGYQVVAPLSAEAAAKIPGDVLARIDVLVTDVVMPGMSGPTVAMRLRERAPWLEVLLVSGHIREAPVSAGRDGFAFLSKPFDEKALLSAVRDAMDRRAARGATAKASGSGDPDV
ncbi:MAG: PAS domain-containing protein [Polyangiaceae bacterium]